MRRFALLVTVGLVVVFGWGSWASAVPAYNPSTTGLVATYEFSGEASDVSGNGDDGVATLVMCDPLFLVGVDDAVFLFQMI